MDRTTHHRSRLFSWSVIGICICIGAGAPRVVRAAYVETAGEVDEELFLFAALHETYRNWPSDGKQVGDWISRTRPIVQQLRNTAIAHRVNRGVIQVYDECLTLLDAYRNYLATVGLVDRQAKRQAESATLEALIDGWKKNDEQRRAGASTNDAENAGITEGLGTGLKKGLKIAIDRQAAVDAAQQKIVGQIEATMTSARGIAQQLTEERGWRPGESGFDVDAQGSLADQVNRRPRDPFVRYDCAVEGSEDESSARGAIRRSNQCLRAARLVPAGAAYDHYRSAFVGEAAELALQAVNLESSSAYSAGPTPSTSQALWLSNAYLSIEPDDRDGFGHVELARALAFSGRYGEAIQAANVAAPAHSNDAAFAYRYAKLMSLADSPEKAAGWVARAYALGWSNVRDVRTSPDLAGLRDKRPERYKQLTTISLRQPEFVWGLIMDDVVLRNESAFDLTNVRVKFWVRKGDRTWNLNAQCQTISAGGSCKVDNIVSIPDDSYDELRVTQFECDQAGD